MPNPIGTIRNWLISTVPWPNGGVRAATAMRRHMAERKIHPDLVLCSAATRARQTLDLIVPAIEGVPVVFDRALYTFESEALLKCVCALDDTVTAALLIGHNPALEGLADYLVDETRSAKSPGLTLMRTKYPTGALASLGLDVERWEQVTTDCAVLDDFVRPKDLG